MMVEIGGLRDVGQEGLLGIDLRLQELKPRPCVQPVPNTLHPTKILRTLPPDASPMASTASG